MAGKKVVTSKALGHFANSKSGTTSLKQKTRQSFQLYYIVTMVHTKVRVVSNACWKRGRG